MTEKQQLRKHPEDDKLTCLESLARLHKTLWHEAEFNDDYRAAEYQREYERLAQLIREGKSYEPNF